MLTRNRRIKVSHALAIMKRQVNIWLQNSKMKRVKDRNKDKFLASQQEVKDGEAKKEAQVLEEERTEGPSN